MCYLIIYFFDGSKIIARNVLVPSMVGDTGNLKKARRRRSTVRRSYRRRHMRHHRRGQKQSYRHLRSLFLSISLLADLFDSFSLSLSLSRACALQGCHITLGCFINHQGTHQFEATVTRTLRIVSKPSPKHLQYVGQDNWQ